MRVFDKLYLIIFWVLSILSLSGKLAESDFYEALYLDIVDRPTFTFHNQNYYYNDPQGNTK